MVQGIPNQVLESGPVVRFRAALFVRINTGELPVLMGSDEFGVVADLRFQAGDTVWIAGEKGSCEFFR